MSLIIFIILSYGITNIIVFGSIFEGLRDLLIRINPGFLGKLIQCMMCTSFYVGLVLVLVIPSPLTMVYSLTLPMNLFLSACLSSGGVWLIHTLQEFLERGFKE